MITRALIRFPWLALTVAAFAAPAHGQALVANLVSIAGTVEVQRAGKGEWQALGIGSPVFPTDVLRTGGGGFGRLVFVDEGVVALGPSTELVVERYAGAKGARRSLLQLNQGAIEALVSGYGGEGARYEVETPSAVARVQGTDFIVRYDGAAKATDVMVVDGTVAVQGITGIIGPGVAVGPNEMTHVPRDGFPSPVKALDAAQAGEFARGLRLVGTGTRDGLDVDNPTADGRVVAATDRPTAATGAPAGEAAYLHPGVPGQTLIDTLSPDVRANTQPLPVYRAVPPNDVPNPPH
jgi:hypothetical protein